MPIPLFFQWLNLELSDLIFQNQSTAIAGRPEKDPIQIINLLQLEQTFFQHKSENFHLTNHLIPYCHRQTHPCGIVQDKRKKKTLTVLKSTIIKQQWKIDTSLIYIFKFALIFFYIYNSLCVHHAHVHRFICKHINIYFI